MMRGLKRRCPQCGRGSAFKGYLTQIDICPVCQENIGKIRADDGPAWLTILLVGHLMAPFMVSGMKDLSLGYWGLTGLWCGIAMVLILCFLPLMKGLFIATIWRLKAHGADD